MHGGKGKRGSGRRKCRFCGELFLPEARNRHHQIACGKGECRAARKQEAQRRWLARPENRHYFRGAQHVERVRRWRKLHPHYWRRPKDPKGVSALQDVLPPQPADKERLKPKSIPPALQDVLSTQHPLVVGLISHLYDHTLQDDIALTTRALIDRGCRILGPKPGATVQTDKTDD
jgi:hypothetical protein